MKPFLDLVRSAVRPFFPKRNKVALQTTHSIRGRRRAGAILVLTAVMMVLVFAFLAVAVDLGYVMLIRTQLQSAADSAALAGDWDLLNSRFLTPEPIPEVTETEACATARFYAGGNLVGGTSAALADSDITLGRLDLSNGNFTAKDAYFGERGLNAVQVRVRRATDLNGEVPMFFARVVGVNTAPGQAVAMAAYADNFQGFKSPGDGATDLQILPLALDKQTWDQVMAGNAGDGWSWNEQTQQVGPGNDGVREANLYPQGTGSPGNRGTVDIGSSNNSTADLSRQIREGISAEDIAQLPGGTLSPGPDGTITLNGDTGISAGIKDDLASIIGETRVIPIFTTVAGNGNNAQYTIVQFVGVRVLAVSLTGKLSNRYVMIQPTNMVIDGGIPASDDNQFSQFLYSKTVWLVR